MKNKGQSGRVWRTLGGALLALAVVWAGSRLFLDRPHSQDFSPEYGPESTEAAAHGADPTPGQSVTPGCRHADCRCENPYAFICGSARPSQDPSGDVASGLGGEMLTLRQLRRIVRGHPDWTSDQIEEELVRTLYTPPRVESLESAFLWVQNQMILLIESQPPEVFSEVERRWFVERLRRVQLELPPPAKIYADAADLFTKNEVYFERTPRGTLRLRVGGGYLLSVSSWFNQVYTLAHELAHSIDPCEAHGFSKKPAAYDSLIQCFVERKWVDPERSNCGQQEQVSEVFADWIAAEILAAALRDKGAQYSPEQTLQAVVNSVIDLCERPAGVDRLILGHHQSPRVRIGQIFAGHPTLQRRMKCPVRPSRYCAFTSTKGVKSP